MRLLGGAGFVGMAVGRCGFVGIFEVGTFLDDILHHAAEKVGLECAKLSWGRFDADFDADSSEWEGVFEVGRSNEEASAIKIIDPTGVSMAGLDEFGRGVKREGFESAFDGF